MNFVRHATTRRYANLASLQNSSGRTVQRLGFTMSEKEPTTRPSFKTSPAAHKVVSMRLVGREGKAALVSFEETKLPKCVEQFWDLKMAVQCRLRVSVS